MTERLLQNPSVPPGPEHVVARGACLQSLDSLTDTRPLLISHEQKIGVPTDIDVDRASWKPGGASSNRSCPGPAEAVMVGPKRTVLDRRLNPSVESSPERSDGQVRRSTPSGICEPALFAPRWPGARRPHRVPRRQALRVAVPDRPGEAEAPDDAGEGSRARQGDGPAPDMSRSVWPTLFPLSYPCAPWAPATPAPRDTNPPPAPTSSPPRRPHTTWPPDLPAPLTREDIAHAYPRPPHRAPRPPPGHPRWEAPVDRLNTLWGRISRPVRRPLAVAAGARSPPLVRATPLRSHGPGRLRRRVPPPLGVVGGVPLRGRQHRHGRRGGALRTGGGRTAVSGRTPSAPAATTPTAAVADGTTSPASPTARRTTDAPPRNPPAPRSRGSPQLPAPRVAHCAPPVSF